MPPDVVIRTIEEDTRELNVLERPWSSFVGKTSDEKELSNKRRHESNIYTGEDLLSMTLRFYTDRLYVGEIRGGEAKYFTTALNLGIPSVKTTLHSHETGASVLSRLVSQPMNVPVENLPYIRIFIHIKKCLDGIRRITSIGEIRWNVWHDLPYIKNLDAEKRKGKIWQDKTKNYTASILDYFSWTPKKGFVKTGTNSLVLEEYAKEFGITYSEAEKELKKRKEVLAYLVREGIIDQEDVQKVFDSYYKSGNNFLRTLKNETNAKKYQIH